VVRERSAKPLCVGSIPTRASKFFFHIPEPSAFWVKGRPPAAIALFPQKVMPPAAPQVRLSRMLAASGEGCFTIELQFATNRRGTMLHSRW
jgi:hypothetical protein